MYVIMLAWKSVSLIILKVHVIHLKINVSWKVHYYSHGWFLVLIYPQYILGLCKRNKLLRC